MKYIKYFEYVDFNNNVGDFKKGDIVICYGLKDKKVSGIETGKKI
jgi:hypothetical protein